MTSFEKDVQAVLDDKAAPIVTAQREAAPIRAEAARLLHDATRLIGTLSPRVQAVGTKHAMAQAIGIVHADLGRRLMTIFGDGYAPGLLASIPRMCEGLIAAIDRLSPYQLYQGTPRTWPTQLENLKTCLGSLEETLRLMETQDLPELSERVKAARTQPAGAVTVREAPVPPTGSAVDTAFEVRR